MIHPFSDIHPRAVIHPTATICSFVVIGPGVYIGENAYIGPGCIIGMPPEVKGYEGEGQGVRIHKNARLTKNVVVDSGGILATNIMENAFLMSSVHIGHDSYIGKHATLSPHAVVGGYCEVWDYAVMGINSAMHQHTKLPPGAMLGAFAFMTKKCKPEPFQIYIGNGIRLRENTKAIEAIEPELLEKLLEEWRSAKH